MIPSIYSKFLCALTKLRKATISFVMSISSSLRLSARPSIHINNSAPTGGIFMKFDPWGLFQKMRRENLSFTKIWKKITVTLHDEQCTFLKSYFAQFSFEWKIFQATVYRKSKHIFYVQSFFWGGDRAVYEIMWKKCGTAGQSKNDNMAQRIPYWVPEATNTLRICNTYSFHRNNARKNAPQCNVIHTGLLNTYFKFHYYTVQY